MMAEARYHDKMSSRARNKLSVRQVASITKVGIYSDGGGLYTDRIAKSLRFNTGATEARRRRNASPSQIGSFVGIVVEKVSNIPKLKVCRFPCCANQHVQPMAYSADILTVHDRQARCQLRQSPDNIHCCFAVTQIMNVDSGSSFSFLAPL